MLIIDMQTHQFLIIPAYIFKCMRDGGGGSVSLFMEEKMSVLPQICKTIKYIQ